MLIAYPPGGYYSTAYPRSTPNDEPQHQNNLQAAKMNTGMPQPAPAGPKSPIPDKKAVRELTEKYVLAAKTEPNRHGDTVEGLLNQSLRLEDVLLTMLSTEPESRLGQANALIRLAEDTSHGRPTLNQQEATTQPDATPTPQVQDGNTKESEAKSHTPLQDEPHAKCTRSDTPHGLFPVSDMWIDLLYENGAIRGPRIYVREILDPLAPKHTSWDRLSGKIPGAKLRIQTKAGESVPLYKAEQLDEALQRRRCMRMPFLQVFNVAPVLSDTEIRNNIEIVRVQEQDRKRSRPQATGVKIKTEDSDGIAPVPSDTEIRNNIEIARVQEEDRKHSRPQATGVKIETADSDGIAPVLSDTKTANNIETEVARIETEKARANTEIARTGTGLARALAEMARIVEEDGNHSRSQATGATTKAADSSEVEMSLADEIAIHAVLEEEYEANKRARLDRKPGPSPGDCRPS